MKDMTTPAVPFFAVKPKQEFQRSKVNLVFAMLSMPVCYILVDFGLYGRLGLGMTIFSFSLMALTLAWFKCKSIKPGKASYGYLILFALTGIFFVLSDNQLLKSLSMVLLLPLYAYWVYTATGRREQNRLDINVYADLARAVFLLPFSGFPASPIIIFASGKNSKTQKSLLYFIMGLILVIPLCIMILLMLSSDSAFSQLLNSLHLESETDLPFNIIVSVLLSFFLFGFLYQSLYYKKPELPFGKPEGCSPAFLPGSVVMGAVTPLLLIYLLFFFSQLAYFVSAFSNLLPSNYSYAEYARRGFFELCMVSGLNIGFIALMYLFTKKEARQQLSFKISVALLSVFSIALIVITLRKMLMYISSYSLTPLRLYTSWFMVFLLICFAYTLTNLAVKSFNITRLYLLTAVIMFLLLCYVQPDRLIASYNAREENIISFSEDSDTMRKLDSSATDILIKSEAASQGSSVMQELLIRRDSPRYNFREFNFVRWNAQRQLEEFFEDRPKSSDGTPT